VATVENGIVTGRGTGNATITVKTTDGGIEDECAVTVQEGVLLNTVIWAECNVGAPGQFASSPEEMGMLYKWGGKVGWSSADPLRSSAGATTWDASSTDGSTPWPTADDPCPDGWRIPTLDEIVWLTFYDPSGQGKTDNGEVKWEPAEVNGVLGIRFSDMDIAEASIFLPVDGYRIGSNGVLSGKSNIAELSGMTMYWASDVVAGSGAEAEGHRLYLSRAKNGDGTPKMIVEPMAITKRSFAFGIRCVKKSN
jgi:hypothetical protein